MTGKLRKPNASPYFIPLELKAQILQPISRPDGGSTLVPHSIQTGDPFLNGWWSRQVTLSSTGGGLINNQPFANRSFVSSQMFCVMLANQMWLSLKSYPISLIKAICFLRICSGRLPFSWSDLGPLEVNSRVEEPFRFLRRVHAVSLQ